MSPEIHEAVAARFGAAVWQENKVLDATVWLWSNGPRHYRILEMFDRPGHFTAEHRADDDTIFAKIMSANTLKAAQHACACMDVLDERDVN